jgi:hypothetical protein
MTEPRTDSPYPALLTRQCYTVPEFCEAHRISRSHFYDLQRRGVGPTSFLVGRVRLISIEAAAIWRRRMESATATA